MLPSEMIVVNGTTITVDAEALATKLGLTVEALKENMSKDLVMSVAETGVDDDVGRARITFRYRARIWRVMIEPDGTLLEDLLPVRGAQPSNWHDVQHHSLRRK